MTLADRLFETQLAHLGVEAELETAFVRRYDEGWFEWLHYTFDYYDRSIELYFEDDGGNRRGHDRSDVEFVLGGLGFYQCWMHDHPHEVCEGPGCGAVHYVRGGTP